MTPAIFNVLTSYPKQIRKRGFKSAAYAVSPLSFTFTEAAQLNDQIVVGIVSYSATSNITSVACTGESNLTAIGSLLRPGAGVLSDGAIQLFYLPAVTVAGTKTITVTLDAATNLEIGGYILFGGDPNNFLDTSATASTNNTTLTTAKDKAAIVAFGLSVGAQSPVAPFDFNLLPSNLQRDGMYNYLNAGSAGTKTVSYNGSGNALIFAASFNPLP